MSGDEWTQAYEGMTTLGEIEEEIKEQWREGTVPASPTFLDFEACVIGAVLLSEGEKMHEAVDVGLKAEDFQSMDRRLIWRAMSTLYEAGKPVTTLTVLDMLEAEKRLDAAGGPAAVARYEALMPSTAVIAVHSRRIVDDAVRRNVLLALDSGTAIVKERRPIPETISAIETALTRASSRGSEKSVVGADSLVDTFLVDIRDMADNPAKEDTGVIGIRSPWTELDELTLGFTPGLYVVAARPSLGKTALACQSAMHAAVVERVPTLIFSSEQGAKAIIQRMISCRSGVPLAAIRRGVLSREQWLRVTEASGEIHNSPLWIDDTPCIDVDELRHKARKAKRENDVGFIVVDYIQLLEVAAFKGRFSENKNLEVGVIMKTLKKVQRETNAALIALSQLNRGVESRSDKRPMMSDLRDSGSIEQDADVIAFLYREEYYLRDKCPKETKGVAEIIIGKNRDGATGVASLRFVGEQVRFENLTDDHNF